VPFSLEYQFNHVVNNIKTKCIADHSRTLFKNNSLNEDESLSFLSKKLINELNTPLPNPKALIFLNALAHHLEESTKNKESFTDSFSRKIQEVSFACTEDKQQDIGDEESIVEDDYVFIEDSLPETTLKLQDSLKTKIITAVKQINDNISDEVKGKKNTIAFLENTLPKLLQPALQQDHFKAPDTLGKPKTSGAYVKVSVGI